MWHVVLQMMNIFYQYILNRGWVYLNSRIKMAVCKYCRNLGEQRCGKEIFFSTFSTFRTYFCTRKKGHVGPCIACTWTGGPHDLTGVLKQQITIKLEKPYEKQRLPILL
jgi:hypothetical protein